MNVRESSDERGGRTEEGENSDGPPIPVGHRALRRLRFDTTSDIGEVVRVRSRSSADSRSELGPSGTRASC